MNILGVDVGGTGIKGAPVNIDSGALLAPRLRLATPSPSSPRAVAGTIAAIARHFDWKDPAGCGFPGVVRGGVVYTAANVSKKWIDVDGERLLREATGCDFRMLNDADAAGIAEMRFGAGTGRKGVVVMLTFGTGIGTAIFVDGRLVPNVELGRLEIGGRVAESWASDKVRVARDLSYKKWAKRVNGYLAIICAYFWPELIIIGGGASKKFAKFVPYLEASCELVPAKLENDAGIIGAALAAEP